MSFMSNKNILEITTSPSESGRKETCSKNKKTFRIHSKQSEVFNKLNLQPDVNTHDILKKKIDYFYSPYSMKRRKIKLSSSKADTSSSYNSNEKFIDLSFKTEKMKIIEPSKVQICRNMSINKRQGSIRKTPFRRYAKLVDQSTNTEGDSENKNLSIQVNQLTPYSEICNSFDIQQTYQNVSQHMNSDLKFKETNITRRMKYLNITMIKYRRKKQCKSRIVLKYSKLPSLSFSICSSFQMQLLKDRQ